MYAINIVLMIARIISTMEHGRALFACYRNCPENSGCLYHYLEDRAITPYLMILEATCVMACILILLIINYSSYKKRLHVQGGERLLEYYFI